jgi:hypothetical protein
MKVWKLGPTIKLSSIKTEQYEKKFAQATNEIQKRHKFTLPKTAKTLHKPRIDLSLNKVLNSEGKCSNR